MSLTCATGEIKLLSSGKFETLQTTSRTGQPIVAVERTGLATVTLITASAAISGLLFGYDTAVVNGALIFLRAQFQLTAFQTELAATSLLWGCVVGAAIAGYLCDRYGRRRVLMLSGVLFVASAIGAALPTASWQFLIARVVGGVAIGCASLVAPLYIAEIAPAAIRGRLISVNQLAIVIGILVAYVSNYFVARLGESSWRWMFGLGAIPAFFLCLALLWIPESPRWLVQRGQIKAAHDVLLRIAPAGSVDSSLAEIAASLQQESITYRELLGAALRRPMVLAIMLCVIQQITGINTVLYYGSILFQEHARQSANSALALNILIGLVNLLCTVMALLWIDRFGRRPLLQVATGGMGISLLVFSIALRWHAEMITLLMAAVLAYVAFFAVGLGPGVWVCIAELFPNRARGRAMSVATVVLWVAVSIVTATFLSLIAWMTVAGVFFFYAILCLASLVYIRMFLPETKQKTLEEIEKSWRL
jgi:sugar porter (SP) family MFS transporter